MNSIEISNLNYRYSKNELVLNNLNMIIPKGSVYGLLGANGAGKTTTLRLIIGLLKMQEGEIKLSGKNLLEQRNAVLAKLGTLIETPSVYSHLSAYDNLRVWQRVFDCKPENIRELLQLVGLSDTANKKAGKFSLGMKQRLSIAIALLNDPELLILDEPTNGLDPNGIVEIRELLISLNRERNITIVISSHILAEIERLATHIGLLHKGSIVFEGTLQQLISEQHACHKIEIATPDTPQLLTLLKTELKTFTLTKENYVQVGVADENEIPDLVKRIVAQNIQIYEVKQIREDLESAFMDRIK